MNKTIVCYLPNWVCCTVRISGLRLVITIEERDYKQFIFVNLICWAFSSTDYVAAERQEDDIHNMQSVIDSLALDYLQISLSHITG